MDVAEVRTDLLAEQESLDEVMAGLSDEQWSLATPSPRWSVADQIGHLAFFDQTASQAITDSESFMAGLSETFGALGGGAEVSDAFTLGDYRAMSPEALLSAWRANRQQLADASATLTNDDRIPWYGPSMGSKSFLTARLMEAWAHGQDVLDTVGVERDATDRLRHIAQLGFITRSWSYNNRGLTAPEADVRVELQAPSGDTWSFGSDAASESVTGPAEDFCLVVTQRRNIADTSLIAEGDAAVDWMAKAQAYAGAATDGPASSS